MDITRPPSNKRCSKVKTLLHSNRIGKSKMADMNLNSHTNTRKIILSLWYQKKPTHAHARKSEPEVTGTGHVVLEGLLDFVLDHTFPRWRRSGKKTPMF